MIYEAQEIIKLVFQRLESNFVLPPQSNLLSCFIPDTPESYDSDLIEFALGDIGKQIVSFAMAVDIDHPEVANVFDGAFRSDSDFAECVLEILKVAKFAKENNLTKVVPSILKSAARNKVAKDVFKKLSLPASCQMHARLLTQQSRNALRQQKKITSIDLRIIWRRGKELWNTLPNSFAQHVRFNTLHVDEIEHAERKAERYLELGCKDLYSLIMSDLQDFKIKQEKYFGFNRITMTNAAVILAKLLGFELFVRNTGNLVYKIVAPYNLFPELTKNGSPIFFEYQPRAYPFHSLSQHIPDDMRRVVNLIEAFPDAGKKPIFDALWFLVPGLNQPEKAQGGWYFHKDGKCVKFFDEAEAKMALDLFMIKKNYINPILLGERDGKCYFITYWLN